MTPEEFNRMRDATETAHRMVGEQIVQQMNDPKNLYDGMDGWFLSSDGWICNDRLSNFTKCKEYNCLRCGNLKHCCICKTEDIEGSPHG